MARTTLTVLVIACCVLGATVTGHADPPEASVFPDSPENRELFERAVTNYRMIDREHSRYADVNGIRLHYLEWGDAEGIPLIWSHGYSSTAYELVMVAPALVEAGYHVYSITYRGHGQTQVADYDFSLYTIADDIAALMDRLEVKRAVIGGLSLGGGVTTAFYDSYPERVLALVLEDGGSVWPQIAVELFTEKVKEMPPDPAKPPAMPTRYESAFEGIAVLARQYTLGSPRPMDVDSATVLYSFLRQNPEGGWLFHIDGKPMMGAPELAMDPAAGHLLPPLARSWRGLQPEIVYRNLDVPVLLIDPTGDDEMYPSRVPWNQKLAERHPRWIHHVLYPDTPHAAHPSRPEWFVRDMKLLLEWMRASGAEE
jgi:pimeloyl-ACP methyl ester carboxylesterase